MAEDDRKGRFLPSPKKKKLVGTAVLDGREERSGWEERRWPTTIEREDFKNF